MTWGDDAAARPMRPPRGGAASFGASFAVTRKVKSLHFGSGGRATAAGEPSAPGPD